MGTRYLSLQDAIWFNFQGTNKVNMYDYPGLEQSVFAQYVLGNNVTDQILAKAANVYNCFNDIQPFSQGNSQTALLFMAAFLEVNHKELKLSDEEVAKLAQGTWGDIDESFLAERTRTLHHNEHVNVQAVGRSLVRQYQAGLFPKQTA